MHPDLEHALQGLGERGHVLGADFELVKAAEQLLRAAHEQRVLRRGARPTMRNYQSFLSLVNHAKNTIAGRIMPF